MVIDIEYKGELIKVAKPNSFSEEEFLDLINKGLELIPCKCGKCGFWRSLYVVAKENGRIRIRKNMKQDFISEHSHGIPLTKEQKAEKILCGCGCGMKIMRYSKWGGKDKERRFHIGHSHRKLPYNIKDQLTLCSCGCGTVIRKFNKGLHENKWIRGHCMKGRPKSKESIEKNRQSQLGKHHPPEFGRKISLASKGKKSWKKGMSWEEIYGEDKAKKMKLDRSKLTKDLWANKQYKKNMKKIHSDLWEDKEYAKKRIENHLKKMLVRPTSYEKIIAEICLENNLPFIYTGDGTFLIGHKNPDFVNKEKRVVIEVFYSYWKIKQFGSVENYTKMRSNYFSSYGYRTIFIDEKDIMSNDYKNICVNKINEVLNGI
jgi:CDGSH-type Zn-finger protein